MSDLRIFPVFKEITTTVGADPVSAIYFGRHCGRNVLVVQHEMMTLMLVFRSNDHESLDFIKSVSSKGVALKGTQIIGNGDVVLLLDDTGALWRLVNAFENSKGKDQHFHLLDKKCYYEWVPFRRLNFRKILAVSAWGCGFACLGICGNSEKKLVFLPSADSYLVKDYTFEELIRSGSLHFCLTNVRKAKDSTDHFKPKGDTLFVADMCTGKTYQCSEGSSSSLVNYSSSLLVSLLHFEEKNCLILAFQSGKLMFHFLSNFAIHCVAYLPKKITLIEKCCCSSPCLLWSDGLYLHHTKLTFQHQQPYVKLIHLKLHSNIEKPSHFVKLEEDVLAVSVNNIYYCVRASADTAEPIKRRAEDFLMEICKGSQSVHELNTKIDVISHFLQCKELLETNNMKEKVELSLEQKFLVVKFCMDVVLKREFWRVRLMVCYGGKKCVKVSDLETDVSEGMFLRVENPFGSENKVRVSFVGDFDGESLLLELGEVGESEERQENDLRKHLNQILIRRNPFWQKGKSAVTYN